MTMGFVTQDSFFDPEIYFADEIIAAKKKKTQHHSIMPHFVQLAPKPPSHSPPKHVLHQALSEAIPAVDDNDEDDSVHSWAWDEV